MAPGEDPACSEVAELGLEPGCLTPSSKPSLQSTHPGYSTIHGAPGFAHILIPS